ncbi:MAG: carbohydrate ABC transporter permease [Oscillospiraceae bacterium]|nr:carbohydrate ABC transporter permease [Oscillospiraceae bacterium]
MEKQAVTGTRRESGSADISAAYYLGKIAGFWLRWFFLVCVLFIILYPIIYMTGMAFRSYTDFYDVTVVWITKTLTLENADILLNHMGFGSAMLHTLIITVSAAACQLVVTSTVGYGFGRFRFRGNRVLFALVVFTVMVPPQMLNLSNYILMRDFDFFGLIRAITGKGSGISMLDGPLSFVIPALFGQGLRAGLSILIFRQIYASIPKEIEEAALVDGCGSAHTYLRIMVPSASNAFLITGIFSVVWYWTDYYSAAAFLSSFRTMTMDIAGLRTAASVILPIAEQNAYRFIPLEQAACLLMILPLLLVFLLIQRFFTNSIDKTGLVG